MGGAVIRSLARRLPLFWLLQASGWGAYGLALFLATLPFLNLRDVLVYRSVSTSSGFAASLVLRRVCRRLWRGNASWPRALLTVLACSYGLGYACGALALEMEYRFGMVPPHPFSWPGSVGHAFNIGFVLLAWSGLYFGFKYYQALEAERRRALAAESSAREAELRALRYQIHPHFLFNTLNAVSTLVVEGQGHAATRMIARLADFFRATLEGKNQNEVMLEDELFLAEQYLEIEKIRLGERLKVEIETDPALLPALVPHLLLQPLVENSIRHGIAPRHGVGRLIIRAERIAGRVRITVADDGFGKQMRSPAADGNPGGIGLANTERRLRQLYDDDYRFELRWPESGGCEVLIELPLHVEQLLPSRGDVAV
ncbi:MAG: histidine kinase [Acidobacteriota bacterium]|nr:histidine kinase [Acidobacteriota bacterium]